MALSIKFNAPVILGFSLICAGIFIINLFTGDSLLPLFSVGNGIDISNPLSVFTLVSHVFGHVGWDHLLGNLSFILLIGPIAEEKYGSGKIAIMIFITALITGMMNVVFFHTGLLGASGIVFMLILLVSFTNVRSGEIPITFILVAVLYVGKELLDSVKADQISQFAHISGGFCGSIFGLTSRRTS